MSVENRTVLKAEVAAWTPMLDLEATHKPTEQNILDSVLLKKDVASNITAMADGQLTLNFSGYDLYEIQTNYDHDILFTNIEVGEIKYLVIKKAAGSQITFSGSVSGVIDNTYVTSLTYCLFKITRKGVSSTVYTVVTPMFASLNAAAIPSPETPSAWQQLSLISPWTADSGSVIRPGVWYRTNRGNIDISICITRTLAWGRYIGVLPSGYRPAYSAIKPFNVGTPGANGNILILPSGSIENVNSQIDPLHITTTISIPLT